MGVRVAMRASRATKMMDSPMAKRRDTRSLSKRTRKDTPMAARNSGRM